MFVNMEKNATLVSMMRGRRALADAKALIR
jgi:hypothetical protein